MKKHVTKNVMGVMQLYGARKAYTHMNKLVVCAFFFFFLYEISSVVTAVKAGSTNTFLPTSALTIVNCLVKWEALVH